MSSSPIYGSERSDEPLAPPRYHIATTIPMTRPTSRPSGPATGDPALSMSAGNGATAGASHVDDDLRALARPSPASAPASATAGVATGGDASYGQEPAGGDAPGIWTETTAILPALTGAATSAPGTASAPGAATPAASAAGGGSEIATLRAILLGEESHDDARVAGVERRLEALAAELSELRAGTRGNDGTSEFFAAVRHEVAVLRAQQAAMMESIRERERVADERCQLRQRRIRTAEHVELRRLRRERYASSATTVPSMSSVPGMSALPAAVATLRASSAPSAIDAPSETANPVVWPGDWPDAGDGRARPLPQGLSASRYEDAAPVRWPMTVHIDDADDAEDTGRPYLGDPGLGEIWRTIGHSSGTLVRALVALVVLLARLAFEDMRAAGERIAEMLRREPRDPLG